MAAINGEHWAEWEVDPSTRSSVHLWTKYVSATKAALGANATETILVADRGIPAVNLAVNPSFEDSTVSMYVAHGTSAVVTKQLYSAGGVPATKPAVATNPDGQLGTLRLVGANPTVVASGNTAGDGWYYSAHAGSISRNGSSAINASVYVRQGTNVGGVIRMTVRNATTGALLSAGPVSATLSTTWQRLSVGYSMGTSTAPVPIKIHVETTTAWNASGTTTGALFFDMFQIEHRTDGAFTDYVDGDQPHTNGAIYEWVGADDVSASRKRMGLSRIRGFRITNEGAAEDVLYLGIDDPTPSATTGIKMIGGETFETNWPIDAGSLYVLNGTGATDVTLRGVIWGVPNY